MSFSKIIHNVWHSFGSLSRRRYEERLLDHDWGKLHGSVRENNEEKTVIQNSRWAIIPPEVLRNVISRLEESESTWPARKHVVACAAVCRSWREICKNIVQSTKSSGKITFPISLKQPGPRDGTTQCFVKRDKNNQTYHLYLSLNPGLLAKDGKFLLSAKQTHKTTCVEYVISMDADNITRSSSSYIGYLRSNFTGSKYIIYDTQPFYNNSRLSPPSQSHFNSREVSPKVPIGNYKIGEVRYKWNVLGTKGPRQMQCVMHSIPRSALKPGGSVSDQPKLLPHSLEDSFRSSSLSRSIDASSDFSSYWFPEVSVSYSNDENRPLVLWNKPPKWLEQFKFWCLDFEGRVTISSVKNFQLLASTESVVVTTRPATSQPNHNKIILQFGKVGNDMFTMDYCYPLSAFQAFAICLTSFDSKIACG